MCNNMDEPQDNYAERSQTKKKKEKKQHAVCFHI